MIAAAYADALSRIRAPDWLAERRRLALNRFLAAGLPTRREEAWKYTALDHLERARLHPPTAGVGPLACPDVAAYPGHVLAFQNGRLVCHGTYLASQVAGTLGHLGDTRLVHDHLGRVVQDSSLACLNQALWQDGVRVYVAAGERPGVPIFAVFAVDEAEAMLHPRNLVVLERGAEAVLVEHYLGQTAQPYWHNAITEVWLEDGARLSHIKVFEEGAAASHTGLTAVRVGRDGEYRALHVGLAGAMARHDLTVTLAGPGGQARIDAVELADGRRHADLHLRLDHAAGATRSRVTYRGLADGRGRAIFDGHVVVEHGAHGADAGQSCRGLLLSGRAELDATPRLEIYADDVKCSHGASIGDLDRDALFYLQSRGIAAAEARQLLLHGFVDEALGLIDASHLRDWLAPGLAAALARPSGSGGTP